MNLLGRKKMNFQGFANEGCECERCRENKKRLEKV